MVILQDLKQPLGSLKMDLDDLLQWCAFTKAEKMHVIIVAWVPLINNQYEKKPSG